MRRRFAAAIAGTLAAAGCDVSYESDRGNGSVRAEDGRVTGTIDAEVDTEGLSVNMGGGRSEIRVGGAAINASDGRVRADFRRDEGDRPVSITVNSR